MYLFFLLHLLVDNWSTTWIIGVMYVTSYFDTSTNILNFKVLQDNFERNANINPMQKNRAFYYQLKNMRILNSIFLPIIPSQKVEWRAISPNVLYVCFPILFLFLPPFNKEPKGVLLFIFTLITYHVLDRDKPQEIIILSNLHTTKVWKDDTLFVDGGFSHPIIFGHLWKNRNMIMSISAQFRFLK